MPDLKILSLTNGVPQPHADLDILLDAGGQYIDGPAFVSGTDRAVQDLLKILLTVLGSSILSPNYGTILSSLVNQQQLPDVATQLTEQIRSALGYLGQFNINEDPSEQISDIINLSATETPEVIQLNLSVKTGSGQAITVTV